MHAELIVTAPSPDTTDQGLHPAGRTPGKEGRDVAVGRLRLLRKPTVAIPLTAALALALTGCGASRHHQAVPRPSTTASTTTPVTAPVTTSTAPSAVAAARENAIAAYDGMWADMAAAAQTADYQDPVLPQHAAGAALSVLVRGLYTDMRMGIVVKGPLMPHPTVTSLSPPADPTTAQITDCLDATHWLEYKTSGGLLNNQPGSRHRTTATASLTGGTWKVTQLLVGGDDTC